jgi:lysophospholipase L1-like esterase
VQRPRPRIYFRLAVVLLWAFVLVAALEMALQFHAWRVPQRESFHDYSAPAPDPLPGLKVPPPDLSWEETVPQPPRAETWERPIAEESLEAWKRRIAIIPQLEPEERERFARAHGEMILHCGSDRRIYALHSNAFLREGAFPEGDIPAGGSLPWPTYGELSIIEKLFGSDKDLSFRYDLQPLLDYLGNSDTDQRIDTEIEAALEKNAIVTRKIQTRSDHPELTFDMAVMPGNTADRFFVVMRLAIWQHHIMQIDQGLERASRWLLQDLYYRPHDAETPGFTINAQGYRGPDVEIPKPSGRFRILCIGGSTTAEGSTDERTYPAYLQESLRQLFPGADIEVVNCGVQGLRTRGQILHLPRYIAMEPDLIIGYLGVNDVKLDMPLSPYEWSAGLPLFPKEITRLVARRYDWFADSVVDRNREFINELTIANIETLRRVLAVHDIRLALSSIAHPRKDQMTREQRDNLEFRHLANNYYARVAGLLNEALEGYCRERSMLYIPFDENFDHYELMTDWCHTTDEGNRLKAHLMALCLEDYLRPVLISARAPQASSG